MKMMKMKRIVKTQKVAVRTEVMKMLFPHLNFNFRNECRVLALISSMSEIAITYDKYIETQRNKHTCTLIGNKDVGKSYFAHVAYYCLLAAHPNAKILYGNSFGDYNIVYRCKSIIHMYSQFGPFLEVDYYIFDCG